nr:MAG TPA_asm: hypothetical protein [Caudoviricetes sp.]
MPTPAPERKTPLRGAQGVPRFMPPRRPCRPPATDARAWVWPARSE